MQIVGTLLIKIQINVTFYNGKANLIDFIFYDYNINLMSIFFIFFIRKGQITQNEELGYLQP